MAPTVNAALGDLLDGMTNGRILDHSGRPYRPATIRSYRQAADAYLRPLIGDRKLTDLHRRDVQALVDTLRAKGLAASTVLNKLDPLRVVCRRALRDDVIAVDPTKGLELPAQRGRRAPIADVGRAEALLAALDLPDRAAYALCVYAGLRRGEARALRARDGRPRGGRDPRRAQPRRRRGRAGNQDGRRATHRADRGRAAPRPRRAPYGERPSRR
jgi:integrase